MILVDDARGAASTRYHLRVSRRLRIANGSGVTTADVNQLLKDFEGARKMMRSMMGGKRVPGMMKVPSAKLQK